MIKIIKTNIIRILFRSSITMACFGFLFVNNSFASGSYKMKVEAPVNIESNIIYNSLPITGSYAVSAYLENTEGSLDSVIIYDANNDPITINKGEAQKQIFASYNFTASGSVLMARVEVPRDNNGIANLNFAIAHSPEIIDTTVLDTKGAVQKNIEISVSNPTVSSLPGSSEDFAINIKYNNSGVVNAPISITASTSSIDWASSFSENAIALSDGENQDIVLTATSPSTANGIYHIDIVAGVLGSDEKDYYRLDFLVNKNFIIQNTSQKEYTGFNPDISSVILEGGTTFDDTPELFFDMTGNEAGRTTKGNGKDEHDGDVDTDHVDNSVISRLYSNGFVGNVWSKDFGWIWLDSDGEAGSLNTGSDDFGVLREDLIDKNGTHLSGVAWGEGAGWIYFSCENMPAGQHLDCKPTNAACNYQPDPHENNFSVCVDDDGYFHGYAWSSAMGWIDFENIGLNQPVFQVQVANSSAILDSGKGLESDITTVGYSYITSNLAQESDHFWRVRQIEGNDSSDWSNTYSFFVRGKPWVELIAPAEGDSSASVYPQFEYKIKDNLSETNSVSLLVEKFDAISTTWSSYKSASEDITINSVSEIDKFYRFNSSFESGKYRWHIVDTDNHIPSYTTTASPSLNFEVTGMNPIVNLISPIGNITDRIPEFNFSISDPYYENIKWKMEIDRSSQFQSPIFSTDYSPMISTSLSGLELSYQFENDLVDFSGKGKHGTNFGASFSNSGYENKGLSLSGAGDYVGVDQVLFNNTDPFTVSTWIKLSNTNTGKINTIIAENTTGFDLVVDNKTIKFGKNIGGAGEVSFSGPTIIYDRWYNVVMVYDGANIDLYVDGAKSIGGSVSYIHTPLFLGTYDGINDLFSGTIDRVKIFSKALNATEIDDEYNRRDGVEFNYQLPSVNELSGGTWYWRVMAENASGNQAEEFASFNLVNANPDIISAHMEGAGIVVNDGDTTYDSSPDFFAEITDESTLFDLTCNLEIAYDSAFTSIAINPTQTTSVVNGCYFHVSSLQAGQYYWRITVIDSEGLSSMTVNHNFILGSMAEGLGNIGTEDITDSIAKPATCDADCVSTSKLNHKFAYNIRNDIKKSGNKNINATASWFDFNPSGGGVFVDSQRLLGYAWNDHVGWVRMNCLESDTMGIDDDNICGTNDFGVSNNGKGLLSGKAYFVDVGGYLYFDKATCVADGKCSDITPEDIEVRIGEAGKFSGYAWNEEMGWVDFNGEDAFIANPNSRNFFYPISEWYPDVCFPISSIAEDHYVIPAVSNFRLLISTDVNNIDCDRGFYCPGGILSNSEVAKLTDLNGDILGVGNEGGELTRGTHYEFECMYKISAVSEYYSDLYISLEGETPHTPGTYVLSGNVSDAAGNALSLDTIGLQVVAGVPDSGMSNYVIVPPADTNYSNGIDYYKVAFDIRDGYGNQLKDEIVSGGSHVGEDLKTVETDMKFYNNVDYDQAPTDDIEWNTGEAIDYDGGTKSRDSLTNLDTVSIPSSTSGAIGSLLVMSYAPTDMWNIVDNHLSLDSSFIDITNNQSGVFSDVGTCVDDASCTTAIDSTMTFDPMLIAEMLKEDGTAIGDYDADGDTDVDDELAYFADVVFPEGSETKLASKIINNDTSHNISKANLMVEMTAYNKDMLTDSNNDGLINEHDTGWEIPGIMMENLGFIKSNGNPYGDNDNSGIIDGEEVDKAPRCNFDVECLRNTYEMSSSDFVDADDNRFYYLDYADGTLYTQPYPYLSESLFSTPNSSLWGDNKYYLSMSPNRGFEIISTNVGINMRLYVAHKESGAYATRYKLFDGAGSGSFTYRDISIEGLGAGSGLNEGVVSNEDTVRFIDAGTDLVNFEKMIEVISRNISYSARGVSISTNAGDIDVADWDELINHSSANIINNQDGEIIYFSGTNDLNITGDLIIPQDKSYTIIIEGGNVYLSGNIVDDNAGNMDGSGSLSIVVLKGSPEDDDESGNFLIDPSVTNIKSAIVAEGSVFSYNATNGIYDGYTTTYGELPKQLYIKGTIMSRNTVGGSKDDTLSIPSYEYLWMPNGHSYLTFAGEADADKKKIAMRFDLAQLRRYKGGATNDATDIPIEFKESSVAIEYNPDILIHTPPLLEMPQSAEFNSVIR